jgi:hypothetical protein
MTSLTIRRTPPTPTVVFDTYWRFATERQAAYFRRFTQTTGPWTDDPIIAAHKFTNAYRASDRVSQYLIRKVIYGGPYSARDTVFRVLLFKIFNKIETWELLESTFGELTAATFDQAAFDRVLGDAIASDIRIYSAAYIMPSAPKIDATTFKHRTHLALLASVLKDGIPELLVAARSLGEVYAIFLALPSFGPFLAYQYAVDLNYSEHLAFSENDFVQPGPGALNGLAKCFSSLGDYSAADAIAWVTDRQVDELSARGLDFKTLWGRHLHRIDCQNLFCETDKYARVAHPEFTGEGGRARIKQKFAPLGPMPAPFFPPKWNLEVTTPAPTAAARAAFRIPASAQTELAF